MGSFILACQAGFLLLQEPVVGFRHVGRQAHQRHQGPGGDQAPENAGAGRRRAGMSGWAPEYRRPAPGI